MTEPKPMNRPVNTQCGAKNRNGVPCSAQAGKGTDHVGFGHCKHHSGSTPNGAKHAEKERAAWVERLTDGIDPHLSNVNTIALDAAVEPRTRLAASKDWLDRAGVRSENGDVADGVEIVIRWPDRA